MKKAPWQDFKGNDIFEGNIIKHPTGQQGTVKFKVDRDDPSDQWVVDYGDNIDSRLCLQIGDKGRAVVIQGSKDNKEKTINLNVCWGSFETRPGNAYEWHPNPILAITAHEQFEENKKNGHFKGKVLVGKYS